MKSKITIDLDFDNQPVIKIDYQASDDVRDKMVKRFLESFYHESNWCLITHHPSSSPNQLSVIRPIPPVQLKNEIPKMQFIDKGIIVARGIIEKDNMNTTN